jgi:hypothetical protein
MWVFKGIYVVWKAEADFGRLSSPSRVLSIQLECPFVQWRWFEPMTQRERERV